MMIVKNLLVTITYKAGIGNIKMPVIVYKQIQEAMKNHDDINTNRQKYMEAADWLSENIRESSCTDWECEITDIKV